MDNNGNTQNFGYYMNYLLLHPISIIDDSPVLKFFIVLLVGGSRDDTGHGHKPTASGVTGSGSKHFRCEAKGTTTHGGAGGLPEGMCVAVVTKAQCLRFTPSAFLLALQILGMLRFFIVFISCY